MRARVSRVDSRNIRYTPVCKRTRVWEAVWSQRMPEAIGITNPFSFMTMYETATVICAPGEVIKFNMDLIRGITVTDNDGCWLNVVYDQLLSWPSDGKIVRELPGYEPPAHLRYR